MKNIPCFLLSCCLTSGLPPRTGGDTQSDSLCAAPRALSQACFLSCTCDGGCENTGGLSHQAMLCPRPGPASTGQTSGGPIPLYAHPLLPSDLVLSFIDPHPSSSLFPRTEWQSDTPSGLFEGTVCVECLAGSGLASRMGEVHSWQGEGWEV